MVEIAPFRAHEFAAERVTLNNVVSPPHDVLTEDDIKRYRAMSAHNIVHLTLPGLSGATRQKKRTALGKAAKLLDQWIETGFLRPTPRDVVYAYECQYLLRGQPKRLRGTVVRLKLDPTYRNVVPHEEIFTKFSENRMEILKGTGADLEPIELLYSGRNAEKPLWAYVDGSKVPPDMAASGPDGSLHKFWRISDEAIIDTVAEQFKGLKLYIADGHHRYDAAVRYAKERRGMEYRPPKDAPWEYKMALLVNAGDPGLAILPTHRVVKRSPVKDPGDLVKAWEPLFRIERVDLAGPNPVTALGLLVSGRPGPTVGAWLGEKTQGYLLEPRAPIVPDTLAPGKGPAYRSLDVVHLQHAALGHAFQIPPERWVDDVAYTREDQEALDWVRKKKAVAVLTHRPTQMSQLMAIVDAGDKMPQKSTYFVPKVLSGTAVYVIGRPAAPESSKRRVTS